MLGIGHILGVYTIFDFSAARARGKKGGRPRVLNEKEMKVAIRLYNERKNSIKEICQIMKISKTTLYNYLSQANK
jgi:DNA invertase Pin-like site-specific DNA recombinase